MNRVVHFELPADEPEKTISFYRSVFGWQFEQWGQEPYWMTQGGEAEQPGIGGAIMKRQSHQQPVVNTIEVSNLAATVAQIEANGGQIAMPRMTVPGVGYMVYFTDPDGNMFGALQPDDQAGRQEA